MSCYETWEARRLGKRDFDDRLWDHHRQHDHSMEGRAYRRGYEEAKAQREEEQCAERLREKAEERRIAHQRDLEMEQHRLAQEQAEQSEQEPEEEPEEEPDPLVESIRQAMTDYQKNLAENVP
jgi:hypothetical protein